MKLCILFESLRLCYLLYKTGMTLSISQAFGILLLDVQLSAIPLWFLNTYQSCLNMAIQTRVQQLCCVMKLLIFFFAIGSYNHSSTSCLSYPVQSRCLANCFNGQIRGCRDNTFNIENVWRLSGLLSDTYIDYRITKQSRRIPSVGVKINIDSLRPSDAYMRR